MIYCNSSDTIYGLNCRIIILAAVCLLITALLLVREFRRRRTKIKHPDIMLQNGNKTMTFSNEAFIRDVDME